VAFSCAIGDGDAGILLPVNATQKGYAVVISGIFANSGRLAHVRRSSRDAYETGLNWKAWGRRVSELGSGVCMFDFPKEHPTASGTSKNSASRRGARANFQ
jgi:hypothetical protein